MVDLSEVDAESMALAQDTVESVGWASALLEFGVLGGVEIVDVMESTEGAHQGQTHKVRRRFRYTVELDEAEDATQEQPENVDAANKLGWAHEDYRVPLVVGENERHHEGQRNDHLERQLVTRCGETALALADLEEDRVIDVCSVGENSHPRPAEGGMQRAFPEAGWALDLAVKMERVQKMRVWSRVSRADLTVPFSCG